MNVKLVSYTKDVENRNLLEQIAYVARVSNPANQNNNDNAEKLVRYLIKHQHWSPLEMVNVCLEIETTRDIARQILRHRSFSFQEFSQRYAVADLGFEYKEARLQDVKNRQNSIKNDDEQLNEVWLKFQKDVILEATKTYQWAINNGIAKEQARAVLPEGVTVSRLYMNGTLRSWVHYIQLRSANGTQKEHQDIALACAKEIEPIFPMIKEFITQ
jgi:thymidylate synthase (FAD)